LNVVYGSNTGTLNHGLRGIDDGGDGNRTASRKLLCEAATGGHVCDDSEHVGIQYYVAARRDIAVADTCRYRVHQSVNSNGGPDGASF